MSVFVELSPQPNQSLEAAIALHYPDHSQITPQQQWVVTRTGRFDAERAPKSRRPKGELFLRQIMLQMQVEFA
jgi:hypothetical protein